MKEEAEQIKRLEEEIIKLRNENDKLKADISDRKLIERELLKLSAAVIQSPVSIVITDLDSNIEYVNPQFTKVTGYSFEEAIGMNPRILKSENKSKEEYEELYRTILSGNIWSGEFLNKKKDGTLYWELAIISPIKNEKDEIISFVGVKEDITKRKEYEKEIIRLNAAVIQSPASILITDIEGNIEYVNPAFCKRTGYSKEEAIGKNPRILKSGYTTQKEYEELWSTIKFGNIWNGEFLNVRKDGTKFWELATIAPIIDEHGMVINYISVKEEITKQKETEEALKKSNELLNEANVTKDKFFSIIAHDLKSPIGAALSMSELLNNSYDTFSEEDKKYWMNALYQSTSTTFNLLENLLTWSRIQRNNINYNPELFDIHSIINENIQLLEASISKKRIVIDKEVGASLYVYADKEMVKFILRNILSNAIKFTPVNGKIKIKAEITSSDYITINIIDNGVGMDKEKVSNLFNLDYDISTKGTEGEKGTGLGLILCKEFIDKNKGKMWVEGEQGKGSAFSFTLPVKNGF